MLFNEVVSVSKCVRALMESSWPKCIYVTNNNKLFTFINDVTIYVKF